MRDTSDVLLLAPAVEPKRTLIPVSDAILRVANEDGIVRQIENHRLIARHLLGLGTRSDIHRHAKETDDRAVGTIGGSDHQIDRQGGTVLPHVGPLMLVMLPCTSLFDKDIVTVH